MHKQMIRCLILSGFFFITSLQGQAEMSSVQDNRGPAFHLDAVNLATPDRPDLSRLNLFIELVYDELQFVKMSDVYEATYDISIIIYDKDGEQVDGKTLQEKVTVADFDETNKRTSYNQSNRTFDLEPGSYKIEVTLQDPESGQSSRIKRNIRLQDFSKNELAISDIIWVSEVGVDSLGYVQSIRPQVSDPLKGLSSPSYAYFEIYNPENLSNVSVDYELRREHKKKTVKARLVENVTGEKRIIYFPIQADSLSHGIYHLIVKARAGKEEAEADKTFYVRWSILPVNARDLDEAIDQTRYIATKEEWKRLKKAKDDQRLEEYKKFWLRRDQTPGTELNEAMESYYTRIEYANQNFSAMQFQGWRTDRGMVYIILGPPDDVERNAYPRYSKPYEIWYYYRYNTEFAFLDATGFGDFHLETPYSVYEFQRLIDR